MSFTDKTLNCRDCGKDFTFTAGEQEFFSQKGFENEPLRCPECRAAKRKQRRTNREITKVVCADCGKETEVPFKPTGDRPVYCSDCFANHRS
jgi:CxxC-x17-CxxC domain-containing protein